MYAIEWLVGTAENWEVLISQKAFLSKKHASRQYLASSWQLLWLNKQGYFWTERNNDCQATLMSSLLLWYYMFSWSQDTDNSFCLSTSEVLPINNIGPLMTLDQLEMCVNVNICPPIVLWSNRFSWIPLSNDVQRHLFYQTKGKLSKYKLYLRREGYQTCFHTYNVAFSKMDLSKQWQLFLAKNILSPIHLQNLPHRVTGF